ncbi:MAG: lysophospholipid acyltransferase family protein [Spirochaetia bacterium]|jgi:1-acyl-sn-glycerol-3-phosphate acyltransferase
MAYTRGANIINFTPEFPPFTIVFQFVLAVVRLIDWLFYRISITGRENLAQAQAAVLVSNHTLLLDPGIIAHAISPCRTYFTMLEDTALIPFLGTFVRLLGAVPIPESPGALRTLDSAARVALRRLGFIHFFPEGECYRGAQELHPFHPGAFLLACRLNVPILPVTTVLHEQRWLGRRSFRLFGRTLRVPPRVTIIVGRPVQPQPDLLPAADAQGNGFALKRAARTLSRQVQDIMQSTIDRAGGSRAFYRGVMPRLVKHDEARTAQGAARVG